MTIATHIILLALLATTTALLAALAVKEWREIVEETDWWTNRQYARIDSLIGHDE